jgi:O-antigen ligase
MRGKLSAVFLFFIFSPFILEEEVIDPSNSVRLFVLPLLALVFFLLQKKEQALVSVPWYFSILIIGQLTIIVASGTAALNIAEVLFSIAKFVSFCLVLFCSLQLLQQYAHDVKWALQLALSVLILISVGLIAQLPNLQRASLYSLQLFYEHKNIIASSLFLFLSFALRNSFVEKGSLKYWSLVNAVFTLCLLLILQVRSVYLALLVTAIVIGFFAYRTVWLKESVIVVLAAIAVFAAFYFTTGTGLDLSSSSSDKSAATASLDERTQLWSKTMLVIKDHPIIGCGAGNWQFNYAKYSIKGIANLEKGITAQHPHNEVLSVWAETGTIGLFSVGLMLLFLVRHTYYSLRQKPDSEVLIFAAFFVGLIVEACFSFPKERLITLSLAAILLAHLFYSQNMIVFLNRRQTQGMRFIVITFAIFVVISSFFRLRGEFYTKQMLTNQSTGNARAVVTASKKAISPFYTCDPTSSPLFAYLGAAYFTLNRPDSLLMYSSMAVMLSPYDPEVLSNYGFALTRYGNQNEARQYLQEALRINPRYEGAWINLVVLDFNQKKYEDAFLELTQIEDFEKKYPEHVKALQQAISEEQMQ